ncbi:MAG TPA: hypothetical protein VFI03_00090 [Solirubrobacterales bacterium]|nr:hypothetical protein [Solirubrobacterales bacterium]
MSASEDGDFADDLLSAKERDLKPLLEESCDYLELGYEQSEEMERFLNEAWFFGSRNGHAQVRARVAARNFDLDPVRVEEIEVEFRALMEASAEVLNLSMNETMSMWGILGRAWNAGTQSCEAEVVALLIERNSDIAGEAQEWLEENEEEDSG